MTVNSGGNDRLPPPRIHFGFPQWPARHKLCYTPLIIVVKHHPLFYQLLGEGKHPMNSLRKIIATLAIAALGILGSSALQAAPASSEKKNLGSSTPLAAMHKDHKVTCKGCHEEKDQEKIVSNDNETVVNRTCVECHGTLDEMAKAGISTRCRASSGSLSMAATMCWPSRS